MPDNPQSRARSTYNAAADAYDSLSFWDRFGRRTIERLNPRPGAQVLDICCGSGASALPAAQAVGHTGSVLAIDLADNLLNLGRAKAKALNLSNIEFRQGDLLNLGLEENSFDAIVCIFGIFFLPDPAAGLRKLWPLLRRGGGGTLAITTWGPNLFEPANSAFWNSIRALRPDLYKGFNPWDSLCTPNFLTDLFRRADLPAPDIASEHDTQPIPTPADWWTLILGTGYRGTIDQLSLTELSQVREANLAFISDSRITQVTTDVLYAQAHRS